MKNIREWLDYLRDQGYPAGIFNGAYDPRSRGSLSVKQAAQQLGVSKETVYKLCDEGTLAHQRIGRRITITPAQLAEYQREQRV
jgi:excisionase family DNA binding protein